MSIIKSRDSVLGSKRGSQWEDLMRKFSEAHREECKSVSLDIPRVPRSMKDFPTGSQYEGSWDLLGMSGYGVYKYSNGVIYEGEFEDGMFHGKGDLKYPSGDIVRGTWKNGQLVERKLIFADGLEFSETDWMYCRMPDRRFTIEYDLGIQPSGESFMTAEQPPREIPYGYYDTGDGFYDPATKVVFSVDNISTIIRSPSEREQKWIIENCRTNPEVPLGPRKDLYEEWLEPKISLPLMPSPASESRGASISTRPSTFDSERETEVAFKNIHESSTSSSDSEIELIKYF
ncbi:MORN repeat-containing protein 5-like isoform X2 [Danaus plexippus]|uniref:MORN repeat-containing protein 5-like isoform X2 n=1 Tax=Danaus plexippus TaxID=13037 RepID=UPI002AB1C3FA|nr:MORN repeat-containing protein 5-like isoform X2 [Danaus plexippus]